MTPTPVRWALLEGTPATSLYEPCLTVTNCYDHLVTPAPYLATPSGTFRLTPCALALILAAPLVEYSTLHPTLIDDWLLRLHLLYSINLGTYTIPTPDGPTQQPLSRHNLETCCGLHFPALPTVCTTKWLRNFRAKFLTFAATSPWSPSHANRPR